MASNGTTWINLMMGYLDKTHLEEINKIFTEFENKIFSSDYNFDEIKQVINKNIPEILDADLLRIEQRLNEIRNVISSKVENIEDYTLSEIDFKDEFNEIRDVDVFEKRKAMMKTIEDNISYDKPIHVTGKSEKMDDVYKSRNPFFAPTLNLDLFEGIYGYKPFINNSLFDGFDQKEFLKHYSKVMVFKIESNVKVFEFGIEYEQNIYALNKMYEHDQKTLRNLTGRIYITNLLSDTEELDYKLVVYSGDTDGLYNYEETLGPEFYFKCFKDNGYLYLFCEDVKPFRLIGYAMPYDNLNDNYLSIAYNYYQNYDNNINSSDFKVVWETGRVKGEKFLAYSENNQFVNSNIKQIFTRAENFIYSSLIAEYVNTEASERFTNPFDAVKLRQYFNKRSDRNKISIDLQFIRFIDENFFISNDNLKDIATKGMKLGNKYFYPNIFIFNLSAIFLVIDSTYQLPNGFLARIKNNPTIITMDDEYGIIYYKDIDGNNCYRKFSLTYNLNQYYDFAIENNDANIFDLKRIELNKIKNFPENIDKDKNTLVLEVVQDICEPEAFTSKIIKRNINKSRIRLDIKFNEVTEYNKVDKFPIIINADIDNGSFASEEISGNISVNINEIKKALEYTTNGLGNCYLAIRLKSNNIRYTDNVKGVSFTIEKVANLVTDIQTCKISNLDTKYNSQVINITSDSDKLEYEIKDPEIAYFDNLSRSIKGLKEGVTVLTITAENTTKFLRKNQRMIIIKVSEEVIEQSEVDIDNDLTEDEKTTIEEYKKTLTIIENPDDKYFISDIKYKSDFEVIEGTYQVEEMYNFNGLLESKNNLLFLNRRFVRKVDGNLEDKNLVLDTTYKDFDLQSNLDKHYSNYLNREILAYKFPYCPSSISLVDNRLIVFFVQTQQLDGSYDFSGKKFYYSDDFGTTWIESEEVLPYGIKKEEGGWISRTSGDKKVLYLLKVGEYNENIDKNILLVSYNKGETWKEISMNLQTYFPIKKRDGNIKFQLKDFSVNYDGSIINLIDCNGKIYYHEELIDKDNLDNIVWVKGNRFEEFNYNTHNDIRFVYFHDSNENDKKQYIFIYRDHLEPEMHCYNLTDGMYYKDIQYILDAKNRLYPNTYPTLMLHPHQLYDIYDINKIGISYKDGFMNLYTSIEQDNDRLIYSSIYNDLYDTPEKYSFATNMHGRKRTFFSHNNNVYKDYFGMDFQVLFSISDTSAFRSDYNCMIGKFLDIEELYNRKLEENQVLEFTIQLPKAGIMTADGFAYSGEKENLIISKPVQKMFRLHIHKKSYVNDVEKLNNSIHKYIKNRIKSRGDIEGFVQYEIVILISARRYIFDAIGNYNIVKPDNSLFIRYFYNYNTISNVSCKNLDELDRNFYQNNATAFNNIYSKSEKVSDPLKFLKTILNFATNEEIVFNISVTVYPTNLDSIIDFKQNVLKLKQKANNSMEVVFDNSLIGKKFITTEQNIIYKNRNLIERERES